MTKGGTITTLICLALFALIFLYQVDLQKPSLVSFLTLMLSVLATVRLYKSLVLNTSHQTLPDQRPVEEVTRQRAQSEERARQLLQEILTPGQRSQLESQGYVEIPSSLPATYRVYAKQEGYADLYLGDRRLGKLCIATVSPVPWPDQAIARILNARFNEEGYLKAANLVSREPPLA